MANNAHDDCHQVFFHGRKIVLMSVDLNDELSLGLRAAKIGKHGGGHVHPVFLDIFPRAYQVIRIVAIHFQEFLLGEPCAIRSHVLH